MLNDAMHIADYFFFFHFVLLFKIIRARFRCRLIGSLTAKRALNDDDFSLPNLHVLTLIRALRGNLVLFLVYVYFDARIVTVCSLHVNDWLDEILYLNGICNQLKDFLWIFVSHRTLIDGSCTNRG